MKSTLFKPSNIKKTYMNYKSKQTRSVTSATLRQNKKRWFFVRYHQTLNAILYILLRFNQGLLGFPVPFCVRAFTDRHTAVLTIAISPGPYSNPLWVSTGLSTSLNCLNYSTDCGWCQYFLGKNIYFFQRTIFNFNFPFL